MNWNKSVKQTATVSYFPLTFYVPAIVP